VPSYTVGYIDVYRNGVRLVSTDYTATTGTTVVLNNACTVGDAVVTESFLVSSVLNAIANTAGSVSSSNLAASGTGSSSNFLRGDMAWTSATGTGSVALASLPTFTTTIGVGGATASASGSGITFPATQSASSDANTLDDYEEGTFTPTFNFSGSSTGITYAWQIGYYTKVGRVVTIQCYVQFGNKGSASGSLRIDGLPFTAISGSGNQAYCAVSIWANALTSTAGGLMGFVNPNTTYVLPYYSNTGSVSAISNTNCNNNSDFMLNLTYVTNT
jgi:hypothetical protein